MPKKKQEEPVEDVDDKEVIVRNFTFFDSDEDMDDDVVEEVEDYDGYDTADEETDENLELLANLLNEIAEVEVVGLKVYKINFHDTRIGNLEDKNCDCDFDLDKNGVPIMPDGGEEFIAPYLLLISQKFKFFKGCVFETNINKKIVL